MSGCFAPDTKIRLTDGRDLTIKELTEEYEQGKINYVYSCSERGRINVYPIKDAFITKHVSKLAKITLDNGEVIKCTPDHLFMLRDGSYKKVELLTTTDSLMPLYTKRLEYGRKKWVNNTEYSLDSLKQNDDNKWYKIHRLVAEQYMGPKKFGGQYHTHHIDSNPLNNNPENLKYMNREEHYDLHRNDFWADERRGEASNLTKKQWKNPKFRKLKAEQARKQVFAKNGLVTIHRERMKNDPEYKKDVVKRLADYWETDEAREKQSKRVTQYYKDNPEKLVELSETAKKQWENEELRKWRAEKTREQMSDPEAIKRKVAKTKETREANTKQKIIDYAHYLSDNNIEFNFINYNKYRKEYQNEFNEIAPIWGSLNKLIGKRKEIDEWIKTYNHRIVSLEIVEEEADVYDLTVPPYNNFALSAGVFVHNSAKNGRYREFQAILPLRGKIKNTEKIDFDDMLKSDSVKIIIAALGAGVGKNFDVEKVRYDKINIMTDADKLLFHI